MPTHHPHNAPWPDGEGGLLYLVLTLTGVLSVHAAVQAAVAIAMVIGGLSEG